MPLRAAPASAPTAGEAGAQGQGGKPPKAAKAARKIPPTVVLNLPADSKLLEEEIFGPVLPVLGYEDLDAATDYISDRDHPLALYIYTTNKAEAERVMLEGRRRDRVRPTRRGVLYSWTVYILSHFSCRARTRVLLPAAALRSPVCRNS